jgi:hypothetical protein
MDASRLLEAGEPLQGQSLQGGLFDAGKAGSPIDLWTAAWSTTALTKASVAASDNLKAATSFSARVGLTFSSVRGDKPGQPDRRRDRECDRVDAASRRPDILRASVTSANGT